METNYIIHLNNSFKRFTDDERATPFHISLYMALFHKWNSAKFRNPISIARDDLMFLSKIGSANTYTKCLKELDKWGYIKYSPSHSYHVGSKIYMYNFGTTKKTTTIKTTDNGTDISPNKTTTKTLAQDVRPYKNSIKQIENNLNNINGQAQKNNSESIQSEKKNNNSVYSIEGNENENSSKNKVANLSQEKTNYKKPNSEELKTYFEEKNSSENESEKFYNYFESNGWLVGGKSPMKNWKAAANNWILNSVNFQSERNKKNSFTSLKTGNLNATTNKNYGEPL